MTKNNKRINNPLTIIAIFAALAEGNATIVLKFISPELHHIFIWFVIGFPTLLVVLFFLTWNFNPRVMYAPTDFKDENNFLTTLKGHTLKVDKHNINMVQQQIHRNQNPNIEFSHKSYLKFANAYFDGLLSQIKDLINSEKITEISFSIDDTKRYRLFVKLNNSQITDYLYLQKEAIGLSGELINLRKRSNSPEELATATKEYLSKQLLISFQ